MHSQFRQHREAVAGGPIEAAYQMTGKRTKRSLKKLPHSKLSWGQTHSVACTLLKDSIRKSTLLSFPKKGWHIHIYTDASEHAWSGVVTQTKSADMDKPIEEQRQDPLAFVGSEFKNSEARWTTFEKVAYAIFSTFKKLDYLFYSEQPVHVHTDHRNLLFVFAPKSIEPSLGRHIISKVQRWALFFVEI